MGNTVESPQLGRSPSGSQAGPCAPNRARREAGSLEAAAAQMGTEPSSSRACPRLSPLLLPQGAAPASRTAEGV